MKQKAKPFPERKNVKCRRLTQKTYERDKDGNLIKEIVEFLPCLKEGCSDYTESGHCRAY